MSWLESSLKWIGCLFVSCKFTSFKLLLLCQILLSLLSFVLLVSLCTDLSQNNLNFLQFLLVEGEKIGQLNRKYFTSLTEFISHPYFGTPAWSILTLSISIYAVNGFSIANYPQNIHQNTLYSCMNWFICPWYSISLWLVSTSFLMHGFFAPLEAIS